MYAKLQRRPNVETCALAAYCAGAILSEGSEHGYVSTTTLWERHYASCTDTYANAVMLALPFWWRLMQCLKVYSVTHENKNLWNALKYSTAFPLVIAGYLRRHRPSARHDRLFILCALVQSVKLLALTGSFGPRTR